MNDIAGDWTGEGINFMEGIPATYSDCITGLKLVNDLPDGNIPGPESFKETGDSLNLISIEDLIRM